MESLQDKTSRLLDGVRTLAIVDNHWGDTGKGKFVDFFSEWADIIARGTGGANAGHTISVNGKQIIFHLIPSGILWDKEGKTNIIGSGVAFDPTVVTKELSMLRDEGLEYNHLLFSKNAKLVLPQHLVIDRLGDCVADGKIGTTGRGIGPVYEDFYARIGLTLNDILNKDVFARKLIRNLRDKVTLLKCKNPESVKKVLHHEHLLNGRFWNEKTIFDIDAILETYMMYAKELEPMITDTDQVLQKSVGAKNVLLEGAQGNLLSIDHGTYPYVTSSDCSIHGLVKGVGLEQKHVDLTLGIVKAFYKTRVGEGPFPTELGGEQSALHCATGGVNKVFEHEHYPNATINDEDELAQGIAIRKVGNEYGATTGRPRRTGWLDLPLLKHSFKISGANVILTKLDVLDDCDRIKLCTAYRYQGNPYRLGSKLLQKGDTLACAIMDYDVIRYCEPLYHTFDGWKEVTTGCRSMDDLPDKMKEIIAFARLQTAMRPRILSVGPDRDQTIIV